MSNATLSELKGPFVPMDAIFASPAAIAQGGAGEQLRMARAKKNLSLEAAAQATRIRKDYLEALEAMDHRGLPSKAYAFGYLRTYARYLGLEPEPIVDQFKRDVECEIGREAPTAPQQRREIKLPKGLIGAVFILACVVAALFWYGTRSGDDLLGGAPPASASVVSDDAPLVELYGPAPGLDEIWGDLPVSDPKQALVLRSIAPTFVEVRDSSGRILFARDLTPGEAYRAPNETGLTISTENAGTVYAEAGGRLLGVLGEAGAVVEGVSADAILARETPVAASESAQAGG